MSHTWSSALGGAWYNTYVVPGTNLSTMDGFLASPLNGDGGGTWTPSSPIQIGGAGVSVLGPWTMSGSSAAISTVPLPFVLGDSDFFVLGAGHTSASRTITTPCLAALPSLVRAKWGNEFSITWSAAGTYGLQSSISAGAKLVVPISLTIPLRVHNGATLASAVLNWAVKNTHTGIPENLPKWRLVAIAPSGLFTPLNTSFTGLFDSQGYVVLPTPASVSAYNNGGSYQTLSYTCDSGQVIDTSRFDYAVEIVDEWGAVNAMVGNLYADVVASFTNIADMRFQT